MLPSMYAPHIYIHMYINMCMNTHDFCSGRRISCKQNNDALRSTRIHTKHDSKSPSNGALGSTGTSSNNDSTSIRAGIVLVLVTVRALFLSVVTVTFIIGLLVKVTIIVMMVLINVI